jgi:hypothetical protein
VCIYVKENYIVDFLEMSNENGFEVLWAVINPRRIPRGFSRLIIAVFYHHPSANNKLMLEYLQSSLESVETKYPNCGLIIAGDFNKLHIRHISRQFQLKQIVNSPTRGSSKLYLILTNLAAFYDTYTILRSTFGSV